MSRKNLTAPLEMRISPKVSEQRHASWLEREKIDSSFHSGRRRVSGDSCRGGRKRTKCADGVGQHETRVEEEENEVFVIVMAYTVVHP